MTVLIVVPVFRRPHRVRPLLDSIKAATPAPHHALFVCTAGDKDEIDEIDAVGAERLVLPGAHRPGDYARKINHAYAHTTEPLLFLGADDLHFHPGWFERATARLLPGIGVVGTNDLCNRRTRTHHSTHSLVTREYADLGTIDEPFKILHEGYPHEFVDDELVATAQHRDAYAHAADSHVEHLHPMNGKAPMDALYADHARRMKAGRHIFERRRALWT